jgi:hypothetical protein
LESSSARFTSARVSGTGFGLAPGGRSSAIVIAGTSNAIEARMSIRIEVPFVPPIEGPG